VKNILHKTKWDQFPMTSRIGLEIKKRKKYIPFLDLLSLNLKHV